uniref:Uncharacterized protein n=1 Tax=Setaria italica TaxID=4555 RepID=K3YCZ1_SETIT
MLELEKKLLHVDYGVALVAGITGKYFADCNAVELKSHAANREMAKRLWDFSVSLLR